MLNATNFLFVNLTNIKMYLRYLASFYNEELQKEQVGFFNAAEYLKNHGVLVVEERESLEKLIHWFDHELPIPDYYQSEKNRQAAKSATSWFKDTAEVYIKNMNVLAKILENYHVKVERISSQKVLGKQIYEDESQVTVIPFRDVKKKVR